MGLKFLRRSSVER